MSFPYPKPFPGASLFAIAAVASAVGGAALISGEDQGLGIDFTYSDRAAQMEVLDTGTPANSGTFDPFSKLTYTSPSVKLCRQSDGVWRYGNHNLVLQSQTLGTTWSTNQTTISANSTTAPDGTSTADTLIEDGNNSRHQIEQQMVGRTPASIPITLSVYAKATGAGSTRYLYLTLYGFDYSTAIYDLTSSGSVSKTQSGQVGTILASSITDVGSGWFRCSITVNDSAADKYAIMGLSNSGTATISNGDVSYAGDSTSGLYLWGAECKRYPVQEASGLASYIPTTTTALYDLPYEWDAAGVSQGIKTEEARTNLFIQSRQLSGDHWNTFGLSISADATTGPDGEAGFDKIVEDSTLSTRGFYYSPPGGTGILTAQNTPHTFSMVMKAAGRSRGRIEFIAGSEASGAYADFDLSTVSITGTGIYGTGTYIRSGIEDWGNGFYRVWVTGKMAPTEAVAYPLVSLADSSGTLSYQGDGSSGIYMGWAQLEEAGYPSSPIHTVGSSVTRAADNIGLGTSLFPVSTTVGTLFTEHVLLSDNSNYPYPAAFNDDSGTDLEFTGIGYSGNTTRLYMDGYHNNADYLFIDADPGGTFATGQTRKVAGAWAVDDYGLAVDGDIFTSNLSPGGAVLDEFSILNPCSTPGVGAFYIRKFFYVPRRMTNTELQTRTAA